MAYRFPAFGLYELSLSMGHHASFVILCHSVLLFDSRCERSSVPTAYFHHRRAQRRSRTALSDKPHTITRGAPPEFEVGKKFLRTTLASTPSLLSSIMAVLVLSSGPGCLAISRLPNRIRAAAGKFGCALVIL
jgi:predicted secreted protein